MVSQLKATRISNKGKIVILCFETKRSFDCYFVNSPNRVNGKGQRVINIRWNTVKKNCAFKKKLKYWVVDNYPKILDQFQNMKKKSFHIIESASESRWSHHSLLNSDSFLMHHVGATSSPLAARVPAFKVSSRNVSLTYSLYRINKRVEIAITF